MSAGVDQASVRLDVWLWAARFYKTRNLCKTAIENGQVRIDGESAKPAKSVTVGMRLSIRQGNSWRTVAVLALADVRRGAPEAQQLYAETDDSRAQREQLELARKTTADTYVEGRPSRKFRQAVKQFKRSLGYED